MTSIRRLYVLLCGYEMLQKSSSTRDRGHRFILAEPICAYLLDTADGFVLIDTGLNLAVLRDPVACQRSYGAHVYPSTPIVLPEHEVLAQLGAIGLTPADISHIILSHVHIDHTGELHHFRHARISVQRREHEWAFGPHGNIAVRNADFDHPGMNWQIVDGDWRVMPGLEGILTAGHTPGHQSFVVELPSGDVKLLTCDAGDLMENFDDEIAPGETAVIEAAIPSIRKIKQIAAERGAELMLLHDPNMVQRLRLAPDWYE